MYVYNHNIMSIILLFLYKNIVHIKINKNMGTTTLNFRTSNKNVCFPSIVHSYII